MGHNVPIPVLDHSEVFRAAGKFVAKGEQA